MTGQERSLGDILLGLSGLESAKQLKTPAPNFEAQTYAGPIVQNDQLPALNGQTHPQPSKLESRTDVALLVLKSLSGRCDLASIHSETGDFTAATFFLPGELDGAEKWIEARQGSLNIYIRPNEARADAPKTAKLTREHIEKIRAAVADFDITKLKDGDPTGEHFRRERARLREVMDRLLADTANICPPTFIVDSGGGYQVWWVFPEPLAANPKNTAIVEGIGRAIQKRYGSDSTWSIQHLMRLPGTVNVPTAKKRKQGQVTALATITSKSTGKAVTIEALKQWAPPTPASRSNSSDNDKLPKIDMNLVNSANGYDELPAELRAKFEAACAQDDELKDLWDGKPAPRQKDETGSGFANALAWLLKETGTFTPTEFGQLLRVWDHASDPEKIDARYIGRTWARATPRVASNSGFETPAPGQTPSGTSGGKWGEPDNLWADQADPPDLAAGVLPPALERWVKDEAERKGVDIGVVAVPAVVTCAAAIPAQFRLQVKQQDTGHTTCAVLWGAIVGGPGSRKSPVLTAVKAPIQAVEATWAERNRAAQKQYKAELLAHKNAPKGAALGPEPIRPRELRKIVMDTTVESLTITLADNPAGLLCFRDELAQWAGNMDAYRAGKPVSRDQGFWLEAKDGDRYVVDRVTRGTPPIEVNAVHVLGGIQPEVIRRLAPEWGGNGLMQRFLIVIAKMARPALDRAPYNAARSAIFDAVRVLMELEWSPFVPLYRFSPEADKCRQKILEFASGLMNQPDTPLPLRGWLEKMEGEWARLCLVFHFIEWATGPLRKLGIDPLPPEVISVETAVRAARFLIEFQYPHQAEFYRSVAGLGVETESDARWIAGHILHRSLTEIGERDIDRACPRLRGPTKRAARLEAARELEAVGWLQPHGTHRREEYVNRWSINPTVHDGRFAKIAAAETARREEAREGIKLAAEVRRALRG